MARNKPEINLELNPDNTYRQPGKVRTGFYNYFTRRFQEAKMNFSGHYNFVCRGN